VGHKPSHGTHRQAAYLSLDIICDFLWEGKEWLRLLSPLPHTTSLIFPELSGWEGMAKTMILGKIKTKT
jgi:hypothetical protein